MKQKKKTIKKWRKTLLNDQFKNESSFPLPCQFHNQMWKIRQKRQRRINLGQIDEGNWKKLLMRRVRMRCHMKDASSWLRNSVQAIKRSSRLWHHQQQKTAITFLKNDFSIFTEFNLRCFLAFKKIFNLWFFSSWIKCLFLHFFF